MKAIEVDVFGLVQGVGFRWFAQRTAQQHNIVGWVSNQTDGSVKIQAQGSQSDLIDFLSVLEKGPGSYSRVDKVITTNIPLFETNDFAIRG
ncbi:MAG TPA: acylphosphatase [Leuconostoc mesenteroides]|uniref:acylphosphatase n=1 Tax=Leuconostoc mesenteroides TaxID=1245 RepID=UPI000DAAFA25|nr:acylphosphatase [Leuconostoc mesenteroides]AWV38505.1 acylphosphatase [Leuconostoc mesenteroides]HAV52525.1 acylphosphatase [Leuconostoc mesenteroides]